MDILFLFGAAVGLIAIVVAAVAYFTRTRKPLEILPEEDYDGSDGSLEPKAEEKTPEVDQGCDILVSQKFADDSGITEFLKKEEEVAKEELTLAHVETVLEQFEKKVDAEKAVPATLKTFNAKPKKKATKKLVPPARPSSKRKK